MKTKKLIFINIYFFIVMIASILLIQSGSYNALALSSNEFSKSAVMEDLRADTSFVEADYSFDSEKDIELISVMEYCYSSNSSSQGNYGLYFYIYNPKATNISTSSTLNKVQLAVSWVNGKANDFEKFALKFCNKSNEANNKNMFYKYQLVDHKSSDGKTLLQKLNKDARHYDISGIELLTFGATNATDYAVSMSYVYTGYAAGYGGANSTLKCSYKAIETVTLDVKHTNYRTGVSSLGAGHQNELNSVYFGIDEKLIDEYGNLQKIKAEWYEYKSSPIFVTDNIAFYNAILSYVGQMHNSYVSSIGYQVYLNAFAPGGRDSPNISWAQLGFNAKNNVDCEKINPLMYLFYVDSIAGPGGEDVTSNELKTYIYSVLGDNFTDMKDSNIASSDLVLDVVDEGRTIGYNVMDIDAEDSFDMFSYDSTNPAWWQKWADFGLGWRKSIETGDDYYDVLPIYIVESKDLIGTNENISKKLMISEADVTDFKAFYATETLAGRKVVLFRYALTDYFSKYLDVVVEDNFLWIDYLKSDIAYLAQETLFFDFDIIQLTFLKEGNYTVIPVVSSPIDVINGISSPLQITGLAKLDWKKWLSIIFVILILLLMLPFLPGIIRFIVKVIAFPFKTMGKAVKGIKRSSRGKSNE